MTQIVGTDNVKDSLLTNTNEAIESVDDAETGYTDLDTRLDAIDGAIAALAIGSDLLTLSAKTSDATLTVGEVSALTIFTNTGATGAINLTLPGGAAGYRFIGIVTVAQYLKFTADGTEKFRYKEVQGAAGGYVRTNTIGKVIYGYWAGSEWVLNVVGAWLYDA